MLAFTVCRKRSALEIARLADTMPQNWGISRRLVSQSSLRLRPGCMTSWGVLCAESLIQPATKSVERSDRSRPNCEQTVEATDSAINMSASWGYVWVKAGTSAGVSTMA